MVPFEITNELIAKLTACGDADFASTRNLWFFRQWLFSWCVIGGLVLEGPELVYEMLSIIRSKFLHFRYSIVISESRVELAKMAAFIGWIFIILGLFGELRAGSRIEDLSTSIQECSDINAALIGLQASEANKETGQLRKEAEDERTARINIQASVEWRSLTKDQQPKFAANLRRFSGRPADIVYNISDTEAGEFASTIRDGLHAAQWTVGAPRSIVAISLGVTIPNPSPNTGIVVSGGDKASFAASKKLVRELNKAGFDAFLGNTPRASGPPPIAQATVVIFVEHRPVGPQGEAKLRALAEKQKQAQTSQATH